MKLLLDESNNKIFKEFIKTCKWIKNETIKTHEL